MKLKEQFLTFKEEFDTLLEAHLETKIKEAYAINPTSGENLDELLLLVRAGGKRVRPALVYFTACAGDYKPNESIFRLGMALELFHTFALIHDDIIDESLSRRGFPTMEARYLEKFQKQGLGIERSKHFATSATILGGDYAHIMANQLISNLEIPYDANQKVQELYYQMQFELCAGQLDDCFGVGLSDWDTITEEQILNMLQRKSGNYSIQKPMLMGGVIAGVSEEKLAILAKAGEDIGLVFQITDDIIGVFGDESVTGKSTSSDIIEGKRNLLMTRTYHSSNSSEKTEFKRIVGNPNTTLEEIAWVKSLIQEKNIVEDLYQLSSTVINRAVTAIESNFDTNNQGTQFITQLAKYLLERKS